LSLQRVAVLIAARRSAGYPVLVAASAFAPPVGYAALGPFRRGEGYAGCAETSVYVAAPARGRGLGDALLRGLLRRARRRGLRTLVAAIGADNAPSIALHAKHGFEEAGRLPGVGRKFDRDLDLVLLLTRL
jgi:Sortase and related acyltransferases